MLKGWWWKYPAAVLVVIAFSAAFIGAIWLISLSPWVVWPLIGVLLLVGVVELCVCVHELAKALFEQSRRN